MLQVRRVLFLVLVFFLPSVLWGQYVWRNPQKEKNPIIQGQTYPLETRGTYQRLPERLKEVMPNHVWFNSLQSAGLSISFYTNAKEIKVRYAVSGKYDMPHMPMTGVSGVDLYATDCNGAMHWCKGYYDFKKVITYTFSNRTYRNTHSLGNEYQLFLPLYNHVKWLEIGVPDSSDFKFKSLSQEKPIVIYGTSIAHGACASRPAMSWANIVQRKLEMPLLNWGFSGGGQLDLPVFKELAKIDARLFIIDCMPNMYTTERLLLIVKRMVEGITLIRKKSDVPILIVEHDGYKGERTSVVELTRSRRANMACKEAFDLLKTQGVKGLYYLTSHEIGMPEDGQVDGVHASDYGMMAYATAYLKKIRTILSIPVKKKKVLMPCKQRREPNAYDWNERHEQVLDLCKKMSRLSSVKAPEIVFIGNSITHYWGGEPFNGGWQRGVDSWKKLFEDRTVVNMGFGWDKIENVLWRVYHGELDGYQAKTIFMMLGTNNLNEDMPEDIVTGLRNVINAISKRQPTAKLFVIGIYPRRGAEQRIELLNKEIKSMLNKEKLATYIEIGDVLLKDEKVDESLFIGDGLHPNKKGYKKLAKKLKKYLK